MTHHSHYFQGPVQRHYVLLAGVFFAKRRLILIFMVFSCPDPQTNMLLMVFIVTTFRLISTSWNYVLPFAITMKQISHFWVKVKNKPEFPKAEATRLDLHVQSSRDTSSCRRWTPIETPSMNNYCTEEIDEPRLPVDFTWDLLKTVLVFFFLSFPPLPLLSWIRDKLIGKFWYEKMFFVIDDITLLILGKCNGIVSKFWYV